MSCLSFFVPVFAKHDQKNLLYLPIYEPAFLFCFNMGLRPKALKQVLAVSKHEELFIVCVCFRIANY